MNGRLSPSTTSVERKQKHETGGLDAPFFMWYYTVIPHILMALLKYIGSVINLANSFSQATRPKHVGQMSELIQQFRDECDSHEVDYWEKFYDGDDKIDAASEKIWGCFLAIKENLNELTKDDVRAWTKDLIINKTHSGLQIQLDVLKYCVLMVSPIVLLT